MKTTVIAVVIAASALSGCATKIPDGSSTDGSSAMTPVAAVNQICEWKNETERYARMPINPDRAKLEDLYAEVESSGNAYVDTLAIAVRNKAEKDPVLQEAQRKLGNKVTALRDYAKPSGGSASFDWPTAIIQLGKAIFEMVVKMNQDSRDRFASDIKTTCRWKSFSDLTKPASNSPKS